jgi:hypothetical protein
LPLWRRNGVEQTLSFSTSTFHHMCIHKAASTLVSMMCADQ